MNDKTARFLHLAKEAVDKYCMLDCESVLVGFSGGEDSCALLSFLDSIKEDYGFSLFACHINHGIRGREADRDEEFCNHFCQERNIPLFVKRLDISSLCLKNGMGTEECARSERYRAFEEICRDQGIERIATAHHANDNAETLLFNLSRGSGMKGACGIPPVRENIIRPLILCSRMDIIDYVRACGIEYVVDSTNADTAYSRNRIRLNVVPELCKVNEGAVYNISRFSENLRLDSDFLDMLAYENKTNDISALSRLHPALLSRVIRLLYGDYCEKTLEAKHINAVISLIRSPSDVGSISLPGASRCAKDRGKLVFLNQNTENEFCLHLQMGENRVSGFDFLVVVTEDELSCSVLKDYLNIYKISIHGMIAFDRINSVYIRSRENGDSYRTGGITKKIKKMLQDDKLSLGERRITPVFCDDSGPFWLPGHKMRDGMYYDGQGRLNIYYFRGE